MSAKEALERIIRAVTGDTTYHKHYFATVQGQSGQTVDLLPDDPEIRGNGLSGVPIDNGIPGVKATVAPGTRMTLYFEGGDPRNPRAKWCEGNHIELKFNDGVLPFARVGDTVSVNGTGLTSATGGPVSGVCTGTIAGGSPTVKG